METISDKFYAAVRDSREDHPHPLWHKGLRRFWFHRTRKLEIDTYSIFEELIRQLDDPST